MLQTSQQTNSQEVPNWADLMNKPCLKLRINGKVCWTGDSDCLFVFYANLSGINFNAERSGIADAGQRRERYAAYLCLVEKHVGEPLLDVALFLGNYRQAWSAINGAVTQPSVPVDVDWTQLLSSDLDGFTPVR